MRLLINIVIGAAVVYCEAPFKLLDTAYRNGAGSHELADKLCRLSLCVVPLLDLFRVEDVDVDLVLSNSEDFQDQTGYRRLPPHHLTASYRGFLYTLLGR